MNPLDPLKFRPSLREKVWGTHDLAPMEVRSERRIGEAWCLHDGSEVAEGPLKGRSLASLVSEFKDRLMGASWRPAVFYGRGGLGSRLGLPAGSFPIVAKLLFGADRLSIQVHPDDRHAGRLENGRGKTELWYVAHAGPEARLGLGTLEDLTPEQLAKAAIDGSIEDRLRWVPAVDGQCVIVPAGTVHSIRGGAVLCEIQQNSDITYRLYDYGRKGLDGKPRPLQLGRAVEVADTKSRPELVRPQALEARPRRVEKLGACRYFRADLLTWDSQPFIYLPDPKRCQAIVIVSGFGALNGIPFEAGDAFLIPAECPRFPVDGWEVKAVRAYLP